MHESNHIWKQDVSKHIISQIPCFLQWSTLENQLSPFYEGNKDSCGQDYIP